MLLRVRDHIKRKLCIVTVHHLKSRRWTSTKLLRDPWLKLQLINLNIMKRKKRLKSNTMKNLKKKRNMNRFSNIRKSLKNRNTTRRLKRRFIRKSPNMKSMLKKSIHLMPRMTIKKMFIKLKKNLLNSRKR